jgi:hypothetical protein
MQIEEQKYTPYLSKDDGLYMCDGQSKGNGQGNLQKHKT